LADEIVQPAIHACDEEQSAIRLRPQSRIVKRQLLARVDIRVRTTACGAVQLVNIAYILIRRETTSLTSAVGKDQNILGHITLTL
jgi:hypothetical protein